MCIGHNSSINNIIWSIAEFVNKVEMNEGRSTRGRPDGPTGEVVPKPKPKPKPVRQNSRNAESFLIGKAVCMPSNKLPTRMDVLKHFQYLKDKRGQNSELKRIISCPLGNGFRYIFWSLFWKSILKSQIVSKNWESKTVFITDNYNLDWNISNIFFILQNF